MGVTEDMVVSSEVTSNIFDPLGVFGATKGVFGFLDMPDPSYIPMGFS